ncbi:fucose permease [Sediminihabitans luteus]|uniref:Fucose permease n=1 Tax=Sediminihabitans luteus TaxID=1138585 RepID=A0A2M9CZC6_9CELL|nr:MFS transporter [Sediminihabitans luteus]PJJ77291.1 fucose permease [Sediminihabitans luteus]GII98741.1 MFS transporter [Sediminihabitans luteus]
MTAPTTTTSAVRRATWAVLAVFFVAGFGFASWASRIPAVRDELGYSEGQMGLLLLFMAIGSIVSLPLAGMVVQRLGASRTVLAFAGLNAVGWIGTVVAIDLGQPVLVRVALLLTGIGTGVWDAAMNLEGATVEQRLGRAIMPRFHAFFSFGTVAGAGLGFVAAWAGVPVTVHLVVAVGAGLAVVAWAVRAFLAPADDAGAGSTVAASDAHEVVDVAAGPATMSDKATPSTATPSAAKAALAAWREPRTLLIGFVVLAAALTEGAANDWVSLAVVDGFDTANEVGALGLAVFLAAMTGMRLLGTGLLDRFGRVAVLRISAGLALAGLLVFTLVPSLWAALVGVALWGLGAAMGFPVGMSAASDDPAHAAARVSVVATIGYSAFFIGPPLIGFLAEHIGGYRHALLVIAVPLVVGLVVAGAARPLPSTDTTGSPRADAAA